MQVDDEIVSFTSQSPRESEIGRNPRDSRRLRRHDHLVEMRVADDDWRRRRLDEIREMRVRKRPLQRTQHRRGKDDIPDEAQANK